MTFNQWTRLLNRRPTITCGACGYSWQTRGKDYALACPNCRARLAMPSSSSRGGCGCLFAIGIAIVLFFAFCRSGSKPDATPKPEGVSVDGWKEVRSQYLADATAAKAHFHGSRIEWTAFVESTGKSAAEPTEPVFAIVLPELGKRETWFAAWFSVQHEQEVLALKPGQQVALSCTVGDVVISKKTEMSITLEACKLTKVSPLASASTRPATRPLPVKPAQPPRTTAGSGLVPSAAPPAASPSAGR